MTFIAGAVLDLIPQPFHRIEFRTVRRQGQQVNPLGQTRVLRPRMEARLIPDHHMLGLQIAGRDLLQEIPAEVQIHRGHEAKLGLALQDLQRPIDILPFIALLLRDHHALTTQSPATSALGMQAKTAFIGHPDLHRFILWQCQLFEPLFQFGAKGSGGRRVL